MNEDRLSILTLLQEGKITVDEATTLLEAIEPQPAQSVQTRHAHSFARHKRSYRWIPHESPRLVTCVMSLDCPQ